MAGLRDLRRRIVSVRNTRKTTYAMKLVSAAKLRRTQEAALRSRAYGAALFELLGEVMKAGNFGVAAVQHPLATVRPPKRALAVVIGGSRGLAGAYNANINKAVESLRAKLRSDALECDWILIGKKVSEYFRRHHIGFRASFEDISEDPADWDLAGLCELIERDFASEIYDEVYVLYTQFVSALTLVPRVDRMLPLDGCLLGQQGAAADTGRAREVLFEPSPELFVSSLLPRIFRTYLRQACFDAKASEHASRMTAMDAATKNAGDLIDRLRLDYNKLRQSSITAQLLDIIGGAEAIT